LLSFARRPVVDSIASFTPSRALAAALRASQPSFQPKDQRRGWLVFPLSLYFF
jgi:hypothetical protein